MEATSKIPSGWSPQENTESVLEAAIQAGDEPGKSLGSPWRYHPNGWKLRELLPDDPLMSVFLGGVKG